MNDKNLVPDDYISILESLKIRITEARFNSLKAVNKELLELYWEIGKIVDIKNHNGWGKGVVENLSKDLQIEYPAVKGFSPSNIWRMAAYYSKYQDSDNLATLSREISWSANILIFEKINDIAECEFYLNQTKILNWSVRKLTKKIEEKEYHNFKSNQTNYGLILEEPTKSVALDMVKDNYNLDFLELEDNHIERSLEDGITNNIVKFLAEMGGYFSFVGRQVKMELDGEEFFIDLLFYHRILKRLVIVELKSVDFIPEFAGKMQFYLNLADETLRVEGEAESIGIIICKGKHRTKVEYTLKDISRPVGVSTYTYTELDSKIAKYLPSEADLEKTLNINQD